MKRYFMIVFNFGIQEGIAMGDPIEGTFSIIITRDGGNTWKNLAIELPKLSIGGGICS
jgi:photosystem II stability/assembly factor-like uncharacterized protein